MKIAIDRQSGFTLIEVLIALTIIAISLTAIVKATSQDIENTGYLEKKALATLVAYEASQLIQLNAIGFQGDQTEQETQLAGKTWQWVAQKSKTQFKDLQQIILEVFLDKRVIIHTEFILPIPKKEATV